MKKLKWVAWLCAILIASVNQGHTQNALAFTGANATVEKAIQLHWASNTNEIYEIDYADSLIDTNTGTTTWTKIYDDYPSQGTNTLWLDTGDYDFSPQIPHPKFEPTRFYRIVLTGTSTGANPTVAITSPANGTTVSSNLTVTVSASSSQILMGVKLYVDGQEMPASDDGSNFVINTCEWWNGQHTLFATAKAQSGLEGLPNDRSVTYGYAASAYVNVAFSNLISEVAFSQPYFEPSLGQTQEVTANFAANCDWTLQIQDENNNTVRNASGSGNSMAFAWDGMGDGETNIDDGVYTYLISAVTNGEPDEITGGGSVVGGGSSPLPSFMSNSDQLWAVNTNVSEAVLPLAIFPPGFDTNGFAIFSASPSEVQSLRSSAIHQTSSRTMLGGGGLTDDAGAAYSGPAGQTTTAPDRPPTKKVKGSKGTFGVAFDQYLPSGFSGSGPPTGLPFPLTQFIAVDGHSASTPVSDAQVIVFKDTAKGFIDAMTDASWKMGFVHANVEFTPADLKKTSLGGNGIFNTVNIGITMTHGSYATATTPSDPVLNTYFWFGGNSFVKLADCSFGSSGTNGLRWMALLGCSLLRDDNYQSMYNHEKLPINNNLHLLLGASTFAGATANIGKIWAKKMTKSAFLGGPDTVENAWYEAGRGAYAGGTNIVGTWNFRVAGWPNCFGDTLKSYQDPASGNPSDITFHDGQVFPTP